MCRFVGKLSCRFVVHYYINASFSIDKMTRGGGNMKVVINKFRVDLEINL